MSKSAARQARRRRLHDKQEGRCWYCQGAMRLLKLAGGAQPADMITLEHVVQKIAGGTYGDDNTRGACVSCNVSRPNGMDSHAYHALRASLLTVWPPCTYPDHAVRLELQRASPQTLYQMVARRHVPT